MSQVNSPQSFRNDSAHFDSSSQKSDLASSISIRHETTDRKYEFEWADSEFFDQNDADGRSHWHFNAKIDKYVLLEVAWGHHQYVEMTAGDIIRAVRSHCLKVAGDSDYNRCVGQITYRDLKQVFTIGPKPPLLEVRQNCIVISLLPVTALLFHDRCVFHVNTYIDTDRLLSKLKDLTQAFSAKSEETKAYFMNRERTSTPQTVMAPQPTDRASKSMMFLPSGATETQLVESSNSSTPRFVQYPLEFAFLEIFLSYFVDCLDGELSTIEKEVTEATTKFFSEHPKGDTLHKLHALKEPLESFVDKICTITQTFEDLLNSPEDLYNMELTKLYYRPDSYDVEDLNPNLEIMLEYFDQEIDQLKRRANKLDRSVQNVESHIDLKLSLMRSKLHVIDIISGILSVGIAAGNSLSGAFGMNLRSGLEDSHTAFIASVVTIVALTLLSACLAWGFKLRFT